MKQLVSFKGRLNRKSFLIFYLEIGLAFLVFLILSVFEDQSNAMRVTTFLFGLIIVFPLGLLGVTTFPVKRLHDLNLSGKWFLIGVGILLSLDMILRIVEKIPPDTLQVNENTIALLEQTAFLFFIPLFICWLVLCFKKGTKGTNKYGHDPLDPLSNL